VLDLEWRPRGDLNPCLRRERNRVTRNIKALRIRMHRNESQQQERTA
jgi:hypothetical protein